MRLRLLFRKYEAEINMQSLLPSNDPDGNPYDYLREAQFGKGNGWLRYTTSLGEDAFFNLNQVYKMEIKK
jgi:hypothetical protein